VRQRHGQPGAFPRRAGTSLLTTTEAPVLCCVFPARAGMNRAPGRPGAAARRLGYPERVMRARVPGPHCLASLRPERSGSACALIVPSARPMPLGRGPRSVRRPDKTNLGSRARRVQPHKSRAEHILESDRKGLRTLAFNVAVGAAAGASRQFRRSTSLLVFPVRAAMNRRANKLSLGVSGVPCTRRDEP
jgi:hypothetical protein